LLHQHKMRSIVTRSVVCLCVCLSTCFSQVCCEPCKNGRTDRSADWVVDFGVRGTMYWMGAQIYCYCYTSTAERVYAITERQHRHRVNTVLVNEIANSVCLRAFDVARSFWNSTQARVSRARAYEHLEVILVSVLRRRRSAGKKNYGRAGRQVAAQWQVGAGGRRQLVPSHWETIRSSAVEGVAVVGVPGGTWRRASVSPDDASDSLTKFLVKL